MAECEWIVLCDYAFHDARRKLCLIGLFDVISARSVPTKHERAFVAFNLVGEPGEAVGIRLEIIAPTGKVTFSATLQTTLPDAGTAQGVVDVRLMEFKDFGRYAIQLGIDGGQAKSAWFTLKQIPAPQ